MSKAFDSINHDIVSFRIHSLGVSPPALDWFKSYFNVKYQYVGIGDVVSQSPQLITEFNRGLFLVPFCLLFT